MVDSHDRPDEEQALTDRLFDLFIFLPTGLAVTVAEELPRLAEVGRDRLGVRVNSARAVGQFVVTAGQHGLKRRSAGPKRSPADPTTHASSPSRTATPPRLRTIPYPPDASTTAAPAAAPSGERTAAVDAHTPEVASLAIPGFDTLSASQVVQRLDGLSRGELVSVRAYETSNRGRRTIVSRVDQLLDERS